MSPENAIPEIETDYDVVVCGAGSPGSVVARRLSDDPAVRVLLLEAGGTDEVPNVTVPALWPTNLGTERDWQFRAAPNPALNGRAIPYSAGRVLGGGSSVNVMVWSRGGHRRGVHPARRAPQRPGALGGRPVPGRDPHAQGADAVGDRRRGRAGPLRHPGRRTPARRRPQPPGPPRVPRQLAAAATAGAGHRARPGRRLLEDRGGAGLPRRVRLRPRRPVRERRERRTLRPATRRLDPVRRAAAPEEPRAGAAHRAATGRPGARRRGVPHPPRRRVHHAHRSAHGARHRQLRRAATLRRTRGDARGRA